MSPISKSRLTLTSISLLIVQSNALCQRYVDSAKEAAGVLQRTYWNGANYDPQYVWTSAVDVFYLDTLDQLAGTSDYASVINTAFDSQRYHLDNEESFDDVQWVSIAYGRADDGANQVKYYDIASTGLDSTYCGGGVFWSGGRDYKNAITSELYMTTSGYLWDKTGDSKYLTALQDIWKWFDGSAMRGENGLFNDGLTKDGSCANNGQTQWTYNQAALLPGLGFLVKSGDAGALDSANAIIDAVIANLVVDGALVESCDSSNTCNVDQQTFKGIAVYFISWFQSITNTDKYTSFIQAQADKVLTNAALGGGAYGSVWSAPGSAASASSQGSALGALVGAAWTNC